MLYLIDPFAAEAAPGRCAVVPAGMLIEPKPVTLVTLPVGADRTRSLPASVEITLFSMNTLSFTLSLSVVLSSPEVTTLPSA